MDIQFGNLTSLNLLWIVAALAGLMTLAAVLRHRALKRFATSNLVQRLTTGISGPRHLLKAALVIASLILLTVALTDPRWGQTWREVPQKGIDVMFAVDVSRSMLAEDATPSRLERARQQIGDMLDAMHGDRVGLVAFAGDVKQLSPLTTNYHDFKQTLAAIGPHSVPRGGSKLGDALRMAGRGFLDQTDDHKAIVVFTDGDDQESDPVAVARQLHDERGIRIFTVGLGDADQGARIPVARTRAGTQWLEHDGQQVVSKMNGTILQQVAMAGDGAWIPAGTKQVDMAGVYRSYIANIEQADFDTARIRSYIPRHQWFIGLALLLLVTEALLSDRRRNASSNIDKATSTTVHTPPGHMTKQRTKNAIHRGKLVASALLLGIFSLGATSPVAADDASSLVADANAAMTAGEYDKAIADYRRAAELKPDRWEPIYNEAVAHYRSGDLPAARQLFTQVLSSGDRKLEAQARFNLANCDYAEAVAMAQQDREAAITKLESAISHYRETLATNTADTDARINTELASRLIDQLRQEEEQQQEQQQQQQQQENQEQQSEQNQDSQQDESQQNDQSQQDDSQQDQSQQNESQQDQSSDDEKASNSQDSQSSESPSPEKNADQQPDGQPSADEQQPESEQDQQQSSSAEESKSEQQEDAEKQGSESQSEKQDSAAQDQQQPSDTQADQQKDRNEGQPQPSDASAGDEQQPQQPEQSPGQLAAQDQQPSTGQPNSGVPQYGSSTGTDGDARPMTQIEADKMLQAVRDRDLRRRLEQQRAERRRSVPVDKDW